MHNMFNLSDWDSDADYLILDDVPWKYVPAKKMLLGGQLRFSLSGKYARVRTLTWGKPMIYSMNNCNYLKMMQWYDTEWLEENCIFVFLNNKLY